MDDESTDGIGIIIRLPDLFAGVNVSGDALSLFSDTTASEGKNSECTRVDGDVLGAVYTFSCPISPVRGYIALISGFKPISFTWSDGESEEDGPGTYEVAVGAEDLNSEISVVVLPESMADLADAEAALPSMPLEKGWMEIASGDVSTVVDRYFRFVDSAGGAVGRLCRPSENPGLAAILSAPSPMPILVGCDFVLMDRGGLPAGVASDIAIAGCFRGEGLGDFCVFEQPEAAFPELVLAVDDKGLWDTRPVAREGLKVRLVDLLYPSKRIALFEGPTTLELGTIAEDYRVVSATGLAEQGECGTVNLEVAEGGETPATLSSIPVSDLACEDVQLDQLRISLKSLSDAPEVFPAEITTDFPLNWAPERFTLSLGIAFDSYSLELAAADERRLPDFFEVRLFDGIRACEDGRTIPFAEMSLSGAQPFMEIGEGMLRGVEDLTVVLFNGSKRVTRCQTAQSAALRPGTKPGQIAGTLPLEFVRPAGPFSLIVLSPSARMAEEGWRNIIQSVLRDMVNTKAAENVALAADIYEIRENRSLRTIVSGEEFVDLRPTGGAISIQGRFDAVRYDTAVARPLDDLNIVERSISDMPVRLVVVITDSRNEQFLPRDMGSLYHWLVNRELDLRVISIDKCDRWIELSDNLDNKIECFDLSTLLDLDVPQRLEEVRRLLESYNVLESNS